MGVSLHLHTSVRMKFVVILSFLPIGVVLGDPRRYYGGYGGYGYRGGHYGGRGYVRYHGKRSADADAAPDADAYRGGHYYGGRGGYRGYGGRVRGHYGKRDAEPEPVRYGGYRGYGGYGGYRGGYRGRVRLWLISSLSGIKIKNGMDLSYNKVI